MYKIGTSIEFPVSLLLNHKPADKYLVKMTNHFYFAARDFTRVGIEETSKGFAIAKEMRKGVFYLDDDGFELLILFRAYIAVKGLFFGGDNFQGFSNLFFIMVNAEFGSNWETQLKEASKIWLNN